MVKIIIKKYFPNLYIKFYKSYRIQKFLWYLKNPHPIKYLFYILIFFILGIFFYLPTCQPTSIKGPVSPVNFNKAIDNIK